MSDDKFSKPVVLNRPDGSSLTFRVLSPVQREQYRKAFRTARKAGRAVSLGILGITGKDAIPYMDEIDARKVRESHLIEWLNHDEGQHHAILLSMRADNPKAELDDVYALALDPDERLTVAAGVMLVPLVPVMEGAAGGDPLPASGPANGGTATGGERPTSSGDSADTPTPSASPVTSSTPTSPTHTTTAA